VILAIEIRASLKEETPIFAKIFSYIYMTFFTKKSKKRNRITRKKKRNSRKKINPPRYKKIKGGLNETMSKSIVQSFPIMEKFPSCGRCMDAIDKSVHEKENAMETNMNLNTKLHSNVEEDWKEWTDAEIAELGVPYTPSNSTPLNNLPDKPNHPQTKKQINPYGRNNTRIS
jgi:hypothetical protein